MNVSGIIKSDVANGPGIRLSVFVSGCTNHCKGCFQPETWDFNYGNPFTLKLEDELMQELGKAQYDGITILGGEPFEIVNQLGLAPFIKRIKKELPDKTIWMYSGCLYEDMLSKGKKHCEVTDEILNNIDVLVDGAFILEQKDIRLAYKGSKNQRIIDIKNTRKENKIILSEWNEKSR